MDLGGLISDLEQARVPLHQLPLAMTAHRLESLAPDYLQGAIAEAYVEHWLFQLERIAFDRDIPREVGGLRLSYQAGGVVVKNKSGIAQREFDILAYYQSEPFIVEVKSGTLNGFTRKIGPSLELARQIYNRAAAMLIAMPLALVEHYREIEREYDGSVRFVELGLVHQQTREYLEKNRGLLQAEKSTKGGGLNP